MQLFKHKKSVIYLTICTNTQILKEANRYNKKNRFTLDRTSNCLFCCVKLNHNPNAWCPNAGLSQTRFYG